MRNASQGSELPPLPPPDKIEGLTVIEPATRYEEMQARIEFMRAMPVPSRPVTLVPEVKS